MRAKQKHLNYDYLIALLFSATLQTAKAEDTIPVAQTTESTSPRVDPAKTLEQRPYSLTAELVLKVVNVEETREQVISRAKELGGFPTLITDQQLVLKVPRAKLTTLLEKTEKAGTALEKKLAREDLALVLARLKGSIKSKSEILDRLRSFFSDSDVAATLRIEREILRIVQELEQALGQKRVVEERARFAVLTIHFRFPKRDRIRSLESPFEWLNSADLDHFLSEY